ncbi:MAG: hypothetical protein AAB308_15130 [Nitrospirota bacterium]
MDRLTIICTVQVAKTTAGHIDHAMAYPAGLQRLGHEVYVMERVGSNRCVDSSGARVPFDQWDGRRHFETVMKTYGIWPRCSLIYKQGQATHGMSYADAVAVAKRSELLLTRSGQISKVPEIFESPRRRAYFDGNPGNTQVCLEQQGPDYEALRDYDHLFTLGLNIGTAQCPLSTGGRHWHPMVRPVMLPMWPVSSAHEAKRFTTISSWKGRATFHWNGQHSGEKSDNWLKFIELPKHTHQELEIALRINQAEHTADSMVFRPHGWCLSDPAQLHGFADYAAYIGQSRAEFSVAHNRYVEFSTGWVSDRSPLYLASGRPVLVQSTGIEPHLPIGKGLLTFSTMEEALAGIEDINGDYAGHCRAAREIAETYFDSDRVLTNVLARIGC